jgi:hypothetical protein
MTNFVGSRSKPQLNRALFRERPVGCHFPRGMRGMVITGGVKIIATFGKFRRRAQSKLVGRWRNLPQRPDQPAWGFNVYTEKTEKNHGVCHELASVEGEAVLDARCLARISLIYNNLLVSRTSALECPKIKTLRRMVTKLPKWSRREFAPPCRDISARAGGVGSAHRNRD